MSTRQILPRSLIVGGLLLAALSLSGCTVSCTIGAPDTTATTAAAVTTATTVPSPTTASATTTSPTSTTISQSTTTSGEAATSSSGKTTATSAKTSKTDATATTDTSLYLVHPTLTIYPVNPVTRYEQTDPHFKWGGSWADYGYDPASGGSYSAAVAKANVMIPFKGTQITLVAMTTGSAGIAKITLGNQVQLVDLYAHTSAFEWISTKVWTSPVLDYGVHYLIVETTGTKNPASDYTWLAIDAVDVTGTLTD